MPSQRIGNIWYATKERIESESKTIVYDDSGELCLNDEALEFKGSKSQLRIGRKKISRMSLESQKLPLNAYVTGVLASVVFWIPLLAVALLISFVLAVVLKNLWIIACCPGMVVLMFPLSIAAGVAISMSTKWVRVDYSSDGGKIERVHFSDGSNGGWGGIFGGTGRLYDSLRKWL